VAQAEAFARIINPPTPVSSRPPSTRVPGKRPVRPTTPTSSKFVLVGTSFIASDPESSFAFIRLPDKSHQWIRVGDTVGHQTVRDIKHGAIVLRDGQNDVEMAVEAVPDTANMLEGGQVAPVPAKTASAPARRVTPASRRITGRPVPRPWSSGGSDPKKFDAVKSDNMEELVERLRKA
jgi:hypothetical protein